MARFLDVSEPPAATDYVMVLGGDKQARPFVAAALVNAGLARRILMAKIQSRADNLDGILPSEQELTRAVLVHEGVSPDAIVILDKECATTFDEASALAEFLQSRPDTSVTIVTSTCHTRRARWIFRKMLGTHAAGLHVVAAPTERFNENTWWHFESGWRRYLKEYFKLVFYIMRY
jgi:uncharacterized SAM-binding protein YcdF (DUF218 family)